MTPDAVEHLVAGTRKGNPIEAARIAGVMGVKRTPDLLPFCHPIAITGAEAVVQPVPTAGTIRVETTVRANDRTGVEMEALTAAAVAALSLYDTAKEFDRAARIDGLRLGAPLVYIGVRSRREVGGQERRFPRRPVAEGRRYSPRRRRDGDVPASTNS